MAGDSPEQLDETKRCAFKTENRNGIFFDACGTGSVLDELKLEVKAAGVEDSFQDVEFFDKKRHACTEYQSQFYDLDRSWGAALRRIIESANGEMTP